MTDPTTDPMTDPDVYYIILFRPLYSDQFKRVCTMGNPLLCANPMGPAYETSEFAQMSLCVQSYEEATRVLGWSRRLMCCVLVQATYHAKV